jgi:hypothetical protein
MLQGLLRALCVLFGLNPLDTRFVVFELVRMASQLAGAQRLFVAKRNDLFHDGIDVGNNFVKPPLNFFKSLLSFLVRSFEVLGNGSEDRISLLLKEAFDVLLAYWVLGFFISH